MRKVFCFWEGYMPAYIKLCMQTWDFSYILLNYDNVNQYTNIDIDKLKRFTLPQQADVIRVHILRDNDGYWLDCDTIVLDDLPHFTMMGDTVKRTASISYLNTEPQTPMFEKWAQYQDDIYLSDRFKRSYKRKWALMGNSFLDNYIMKNFDITIGNINFCFPEMELFEGNDKWYKYQRFYFKLHYHLKDIKKTSLIMLHNSWTPEWYKQLSEEEVLNHKCTMSNFLREANQ